jgi:tRNA A37 threonylcarbamoyladenosine modification protein TsaB
VVPIDSLRLLSLPLLERHRRVCAMIDARRGEVYAAIHERAPQAERRADAAAVRVVLEPCARQPAVLLEALDEAPDAFVGSGALAARDEIARRFPRAVVADPAGSLPDTAFLARIAPGMPVLDEAAVRRLEPLYVRPSGAERVRLRRHGVPRDGAGGTGDA